MNLRVYIILLITASSFYLKAQVPYNDHQNPFSQTYLNLNYNSYADVGADLTDTYFIGQMNFFPQAYGFIFKRNNSNVNSSFKVYYCHPQTRFTSIIIKPSLGHYFAFQNTDSDVGCSSAGLKVYKLNKNDLSVTDSVFFCDPTKPSAGNGYYMYNRFYVASYYAEYYPIPPPHNFKTRNLIRIIDTNLVMLNEQIIGDTSVTFGTYCLREAIDTGIIMNTINSTQGCAMLIKLDTMGVEQWRKNYYTQAQTGGCGTSSGYGIMGLQNYTNGYVALFNASNTGLCSYLYSQSIIAKLDKYGNLVKEVQYTTSGDTTLEFYSSFTNYTKRTKFYNILVKTNDGNFASVIQDREAYGFNQHENYIVILDTNLNIIHRSAPLGSLYGFDSPGMVQGADSTFYLGGGVMNSTNDGMNVRIYEWKPGGQVGILEYGDKPKVKLYPNPAYNQLTIQDFGNNQLLTIYNNMGQLVYSQTQSNLVNINVSTWAKGLYLIELSDANTNKKETYKFIVE